MSIDRREFIPVIRNAYVIRNPERRDGREGKRHNRSGLFTRIIFAVNILIRSLGAAEKAADRVALRRQPPAQLLPFHAANVLLQKGEAAMIAFDGEEA